MISPSLLIFKLFINNYFITNDIKIAKKIEHYYYQELNCKKI